MSGPQAHSILRSIFRSKKPVDAFTSHRLYLGLIVNPETDDPVDEVFAVFMHKPSTYTREEMAEVYSHGGIAPQRQILSLMVQSGARVAEPGEFTKRAFLNGRIDLAQAESVLDIIRSESDEETKSALQHLTGRFSERIGLLREELKHALANTEALIDFPEEELDVDKKQTLSVLEKTRHYTRELIASYANGRALKNGLEVLIVGRTNVGKSSLLNALLMEEKAIVTPLPGTTRDLVEDVLHVKGIKLRITDTAGLRKPRDVAEKEGIDRVKKRIPGADVILWVLDNAEDYLDEDKQIFQSIQQKTIVIAINKTDLPEKLPRHKIPAGGKRVEVCALTGAGLESLKQVLYETVMGKEHRSPAILITNVRHRDTLIKADEAIERAIVCSNNGEPFELTAFELREALSRLGEITGETCTDEILDDIFSRFCIGK